MGRADDLIASGALASLLASGAKLTDQVFLVSALDEDAEIAGWHADFGSGPRFRHSYQGLIWDCGRPRWRTRWLKRNPAPFGSILTVEMTLQLIAELRPKPPPAPA